MNSMSGKQLSKLLEGEGWILLRVRGSHHIYSKPGNAVRLSVPIHGNKSLKIGLLKHLLKMAGLSEEISNEPITPEESITEDISEESDSKN